MSVIELGESIPALTPHVSFSMVAQFVMRVDSEQAASVSLPTWQDNIGYEEGQQRVLSKMVTGYPRYASVA